MDIELKRAQETAWACGYEIVDQREFARLTRERYELGEALNRAAHDLKKTAEFMASEFYEGEMIYEAAETLKESDEAFAALATLDVPDTKEQL